MPLLLAFSFFIGFLVEGMVGLGGTLIAYSFLLFFFETKALIISTIILPILASFFILFSDVKNVAWRALFKYMPFCLAGLPIGILLFEYLPDYIVLKTVAIFLILYGVRSAFFGEIVVTGWVGKLIVFISGIIHGLIGTAGPIAIIGMKNSLKNKAEVRASMAVFFIVLNVLRIIQLSFSQADLSIFIVNIWVVIPLICGILVGYYLHNKITEKQFTFALSIFFMVAGFLLLFR